MFGSISRKPSRDTQPKELRRQLEINREARCQLECRAKDFEEKKQIRIRHLVEQKDVSDEYSPPFDKKVMNKVRQGESIWFHHVPFR